MHSGIVQEVTGDCMKVRIIQTSACASCKVASQCHAAESKEKTIDVYDVEDAATYHVGESVKVIASAQTGMHAVVLAFGIPFLILVGVVFAASRLTDDEPTMALAGLTALIPYYIVLYLARDRIRQKFSFHVTR
jgi:sigma-E factor negative regulatory protein RseC